MACARSVLEPTREESNHQSTTEKTSRCCDPICVTEDFDTKQARATSSAGSKRDMVSDRAGSDGDPTGSTPNNMQQAKFEDGICIGDIDGDESRISKDNKDNLDATNKSPIRSQHQYGGVKVRL